MSYDHTSDPEDGAGSRHFRYLGVITCFYIALQLVSDVTAGKIVQLGMFSVSATVLYFPVTYIFADMLTEVYGYARARSVLWIVLSASVLAGAIYQLVVWLPPAPGFDATAAYARVLGSVPRILVGGWLAVFLGEIINDYVMAKLKVITNGRWLWTRTVGSTIVGQFANTVVFYTIGLYGILPGKLLVASILSGWFLKVVVETVMTPFTYWFIARLKSIEESDYYDRDTNFNPFVFHSPF